VNRTSSQEELLSESPEDLLEDAPCGYLATELDGTILKVNRTFESWTGLDRRELLSGKRFQDLLPPGGRIYHETHLSPLLRMRGSVREVALEIVRADGSRLPALINSAVRCDENGTQRLIRTTVFDATDRRRYEQELLQARRGEREIARQLQRSLLSGELPEDDGLDLAVAYEPGVSGLEVGGDWYDAFWLEPGETLALVVGDVVGRGLEAAASMGQLRSAVRALVTTGSEPAALLESLDRYVRRHGVGRMATLVVAHLNLRSRSLSFACAGQLPPLILENGEPRFLWEGRSAPLDPRLGDGHRDQSTVELAPASSVLLYTDGLVERRDESIDRGMQRLGAHAGSAREQTSEQLARGLVRALRDPEQTDDVCLLIARLL
jgi:PAS domain S-box-containing protein